MKFNINLGKIEINEVKLENIVIGATFNPAEIKELHQAQKEIVKDLPQLVEGIKDAMLTAEKASKEIEEERNKEAV
jgi:hypothetical protein